VTIPPPFGAGTGPAHANPRQPDPRVAVPIHRALVADRHTHLVPLVRIALLVALGDFVTKEAALRFVVSEPTVFSSWLRFAVVHNQGAAFGVSLGLYTWQLNLAFTIAAIVMVLPVSGELARVDRTSPRALGLIVGGAIGNLVSLLVSPRGVVDFIAVRYGDADLVLNVADVAAYVGLAMIARTGFLIVAEIRRTVRPDVRMHVAPQLALTSAASRPIAFADREVARPVVRDEGGDLADVTPLGDTPIDLRVPLADLPMTWRADIQEPPRADPAI
jgi:signal peptidase II